MSDSRPFHAHVYFDADERVAAATLHAHLRQEPATLVTFVGEMRDHPVGPHPLPQFEVHFDGANEEVVTDMLRRSGLRALIHPLTDDDVADHTSLARWIGEPIALDLGVLDPPGRNQGIARFGKSDI